MKVDKLSRLFSVFNSDATEKGSSTKTTETQPTGGASSEAVTVARSVADNQRSEDPAARTQRVQDLKSQVAQGTYRPSSEAVAKSVAADLFA
jgi:anti-sigma28 factor (negative regulator of flagellin synthesis)